MIEEAAAGEIGRRRGIRLSTSEKVRGNVQAAEAKENYNMIKVFAHPLLQKDDIDQ